MSFETEKNKSNSLKIFLCELDLPIGNDVFFSYTAGIWSVPLSPNFGEDGVSIILDDGYEMTWEETNLQPLYRIGSIKVNGEDFSNVSSITACIAQNKSFYYNSSIFMLYIHFDGFTIPWHSIVRLGIILGFSNKISSAGAYYDDIYYHPRIISIPELTKQKDNLFAGVLQFKGGSVTLINSDGFFEDIIANYNIFGQPLRIYMGFEGLDFDDFEQIHAGNINDYSFNRDQFIINIADTRKFLSRKIPFNQFSTSDYPYIKTKNAGKVKPLAWGDVTNAKLICLNETSTAPSTYQFYIADTTNNNINSVSVVRINDIPLSSSKWSFFQDRIYISSAASTTDAGGQTLAVASKLSQITADFNSYSTDTLGLNVITNILNDYAYISTETAVNNYDFTEWTSELTYSQQVGIYLDKETEINEIIKDICIAEDGIFLVLDDGRFTFRHESTEYESDRTIYQDEWINDPQIEYKRDEFLTSVKVKHNQDQKENEWESYTNTEYESTAFDKYKTYSQKEIETILTSTDGVYRKAQNVMTRSKDIVPTVTRILKTQHIDLDIMDIITACHDRLSADTKQWNLYRLIGIQKNLNTAEITWTMRWLAESTFSDTPSTFAYSILTYGSSILTYEGFPIIYHA